jgi:hypothetical protein
MQHSVAQHSAAAFTKLKLTTICTASLQGM